VETSKQSTAIARRMVAEYNKGTADWVESCHAENTSWTELPFAGGPSGRGGGRAALRKAAEEAVAAFPDRRMNLRNLIADGHQVALELDWTGTVAVARPGINVGDIFKLRIAMFLAVEDGKIVKQTDYCVRVESG